MPPRAEQISQRQLVYELKHAIDVCRRRPWDLRARAHLDRLVAENPRGIESSHVRYNIGRVRRAWLAARLARAALPTRSDGRSFGTRMPHNQP